MSEKEEKLAGEGKPKKEKVAKASKKEARSSAEGEQPAKKAKKNKTKVAHTVHLEFSDEALAVQTGIDAAFAAIKNLKTSKLIKGISSISYGPHSSGEGFNGRFNYGMSIIFDSEASRDAYLPHPEHDKVKAMILPMLKDGLNSIAAVDWLIEADNSV